MSLSEHLVAKKPLILITNKCNLCCGGCNQFCPNFRPEQRWSISLEQLQENIETLSMFYPHIEIFGGEPTIHPEWDRIRELFWSFPHIDFRIFTNMLHTQGCLPEHEDNIWYHCDNEMREWGHYLPTLVAPIDIYKVPDHGFYWQMAQQYCWMWKDECSGMLYDNRVYMCQPAGAFDRILGTNYGWEFVPGKNPFLRSNEEIAEQAHNFCYRCAFSLDAKTKEAFTEQQPITQPSLCTITNHQYITRRTKLLDDQEVLAVSPKIVQQIRKEAMHP